MLMTNLLTSKYLKILSSSLVTLGVCHYVWKIFFQKEKNHSKDIEIEKDVNYSNNPEDITKTDKRNNLEVQLSDLTFDKIVGCSNVQEELKQYVEYLKSPQIFKDLKISMRTGCLLVGPTGSGKRTIAHALSGTAKVALLEIFDAISCINSMFGYELVCNSRQFDLK